MKSLLLNGKKRETAAGTVSELVKELNLDPARIALEINGGIVGKARYGETPVNDGDKIEIVHFVGGG
jgi:thiamine biosynthesis protein ThiS